MTGTKKIKEKYNALIEKSRDSYLSGNFTLSSPLKSITSNRSFVQSVLNKVSPTSYSSLFHEKEDLRKEKEILSKELIIKILSEKNSVEDILSFSHKILKEDVYRPVSSRIKVLLEDYDDDDCDPLSLGSLRSLIVFFHQVQGIKKKTAITLNDLGRFHVNWKKDKKNMLSVCFKDQFILDYVIFKPSKHSDKRIILNGSMNILDFIDYLFDLKLKVYKEV